MSKSDFERLSSEDVDARLTHEGLTHEGFGEPETFAEKISWGRVLSGAVVLIASVGGAAYWAGGRSIDAISSRATSFQQSQAALVPAEMANDADRAPLEHAVAAQPVILVEAVPEESPPRESLPGGVAPRRTSVSFMEPLEGSTVSSTMLVQGMARNVPEAKHLWLVTRRDASAGFWPKERIELAADGKFEMQIWDFGDDGQFSICLLATDAVDTRRFNDWLLAGDRDDLWPALAQDRARSTTLGCQDVKLDKELNH
jgi:hypothetical protein